MICFSRLLLSATCAVSLFCSGDLLAQSATSAPQPFGSPDGRSTLQGFGPDTVRIPYTKDDLERAEGLMRRYDANRDGYLDLAELKEGSWRFGAPLEYDFNSDSRISKIEMAQRLAARSSGEQPKPPTPRYSVVEQMRRDNSSSSSSTSDNFVDDWRRSERRRGDWRLNSNDRNTSGNRRSRELAYDILTRFDRDQSRSLDEFERKDLGIDVTRFDVDGDGSIDGVELYQWIDSQISERIGDLTDVLPEWFFEKDTNQDNQITMAEFSNEWTDELSNQFNAMDTNQDGMITAVELVEARSITGGTYTSSTATLLAPRTTATSSIAVDDDFQIEKLRVQVSITHDFTEQLSLQLIAPSGKQIDLVRGAGGSGDHFEGTMFDDESGERIQRSSAPFRGSFQPVAVERNQPSLSSLIDTSMKGEWKLAIDGTRNQRFGILHSWSLIVVPRKQTGLPASSIATSETPTQASN